ncbi:MAG: hypothetical protein Q8P67_11400 [archaeon]|nr:hypothetical protein [archaeon]
MGELHLDISALSPAPGSLSHLDHCWRPVALSDGGASIVLAPSSPTRRPSFGSPPRSPSGSFIAADPLSPQLLSSSPLLSPPHSPPLSPAPSAVSSSTDSISFSSFFSSSAASLFSSSPSSSSSSSSSFSSQAHLLTSDPPAGQLNLAVLRHLDSQHSSSSSNHQQSTAPALKGIAERKLVGRRRKKILSCPVPGADAFESLSWQRARPSNRLKLRSSSIRTVLGSARGSPNAATPRPRSRAVTFSSLSHSEFHPPVAVFSTEPSSPAVSPPPAPLASVSPLLSPPLQPLSPVCFSSPQPMLHHPLTSSPSPMSIPSSSVDSSSPFRYVDSQLIADDFEFHEQSSDDYLEEVLDEQRMEELHRSFSRAPPAAAVFAPAPSSSSPQPPSQGFSIDYRTDWNARFQSISRRIHVLTKGDVNGDLSADLIQAQNDLINLTTDFLFFVRQYGRIIITEVSTPQEHKTIKAITSAMGGSLGGDKYRVANILVKFAGDHLGEKVAAHDLKGLQCFMNCHQPTVSFPIMAILDYLGFRLVAMSILPINSNTIIHGSNNAGQKVHVSRDRNLMRSLRRFASILNLMPHNLESPNVIPESIPSSSSQTTTASPFTCSTDPISSHPSSSSSSSTTTTSQPVPSLKLEVLHADDGASIPGESPRSIPGMYFATDIEVHKGWDGRFYLVDFSRVLPPVTPRRTVPNSHLYELFRPEFIKKYPIPLCSDSYSRFVKDRKEAILAKRNVDTATAHLRDQLVPRVARRLPGYLGGNPASFRLTQTLHSKGCNVRYLGLILRELIASRTEEQAVKEGAKASSPRLAAAVDNAISIVAIELYARGFNSLIRQVLRQNTFAHAVPILSEHRRMIVSNLNLLFGKSPSSTQFWETELRRSVTEKFEGLDEIFHTLPMDHLVHLTFPDSSDSGSSGRFLLFKRIAPLLGLKMSQEFLMELRDNPRRLYDQGRPFSQNDLQEVVERTKTISLISHAHGYLLMHRGIIKRTHDPQSAMRSFDSAISHFQKALNTSRNDKVVLRDLARALEYLEEEKMRETQLMGFGASNTFHAPLIEQANRYYKKAIDLDPEDPRSLLFYAKFLDRFGQSPQAEDFYLRTLEVDKDYINALIEYGFFLQAHEKQSEAESFLERARLLSASRSVRPGVKSRPLRCSDDS